MINKYIDSKVYKISDLTNNHCYIGSTIQTIQKRLQGHVNDSRKYIDGYGCGSQEIIKNNNYKIELIEAYPCNNLQELHKREQYHIDNYEGILVNKIKSYISPEQIKEYRKKIYLQNQDKILQKKKEYDSLYIKCPCGGGYSMSHRARHLSSKKCKNFHLNYYLNHSIICQPCGNGS